MYNNQPRFLRVQCIAAKMKIGECIECLNNLLSILGNIPLELRDIGGPFASTTFSYSINRALSGAPDECIPEDPCRRD
jgi:hypothetical protein